MHNLPNCGTPASRAEGCWTGVVGRLRGLGVGQLQDGEEDSVSC